MYDTIRPLRKLIEVDLNMIEKRIGNPQDHARSIRQSLKLIVEAAEMREPPNLAQEFLDAITEGWRQRAKARPA
jgi:hypothetical protein